MTTVQLYLTLFLSNVPLTYFKLCISIVAQESISYDQYGHIKALKLVKGMTLSPNTAMERLLKSPHYRAFTVFFSLVS